MPQRHTKRFFRPLVEVRVWYGEILEVEGNVQLKVPKCSLTV